MAAHSVVLLRPRTLRIVAQTNRQPVPVSKASIVPRARSAHIHSIQRPNIRAQAQARRPIDDNWVSFDGEEEWDAPEIGPSRLSGPIVKQSFRAVGMVVDRLSDIALQIAPEDASPNAVRIAVIGGLVLLLLSFVKGLLSLFLTLGTVMFGAFVSVKVFGLDVSGSTDGSRSGKSMGRSKRGAPRERRSIPSAQDRDSDGPNLAGLLGSVLNTGSGDSDDGLVDVWFERKSTKGGKKKAPQRKR